MLRFFPIEILEIVIKFVEVVNIAVVQSKVAKIAKINRSQLKMLDFKKEKNNFVVLLGL